VWQITPAGDRALLVRVADTMSEEALATVLALERALRRRSPGGLRSMVPAYASLLCAYDPEVTDFDRLAAGVRAIRLPRRPALPAGRQVDVPVRYEGPDLERVAGQTGLAVPDVVARHAGLTYLVYGVGFAPGFTYCGELPPELATPRLGSPRTVVPAGSVGIAGRQTGIYAVASPGGWNMIGRTEMQLFDSGRRPPALLRPGDRIRFRPQ